MKELKWRADMTIEEKVDAGFKLMSETFKEVFRRMDLQKDEMNDFRRFMSQKLVEINGRFNTVDDRFCKIDERFDKTDARVDARFGQVETAMLMISRQVRRMDETVTTTAENVSVIKMNVKDLHTRLDGLATTVDLHDTAIMGLTSVETT